MGAQSQMGKVGHSGQDVKDERWTSLGPNFDKAILFALSTGKRLEADPENPGQTKEIKGKPRTSADIH